jgi:hypothetical protein
MIRAVLVWLASNMEMLRVLVWRSVNDQEILLMQVHCRRSLIAVMLDPLCQEHRLCRAISVGRYLDVLACCTRLACS